MDVIKIGGSILFNGQGNFNKGLFERLISSINNHISDFIIVIGCGEYLHKIVENFHSTNNETRILTPWNKRRDAYVEVSSIISDRLKFIEIAYRINTYRADQIFFKANPNDKSLYEIKSFSDSILNLPFIISGGTIKDCNTIYSVVSSDTIAAYLSNKFKTRRLILFSDVDGIFKDKLNKEIFSVFTTSDFKKQEITGGMYHKIRRLNNTLTHNCEVIIANGLKDNIVDNVLTGHYEQCTQLIFKT